LCKAGFAHSIAGKQALCAMGFEFN